MDRPNSPYDISCRLGRDWPDARGIWQSNDLSIGAFINGRDHIVLSAIDFKPNLKSLFVKFYKFVQQVNIFSLIKIFFLNF